jgi:hypothetical protein
MKKNIPQGGDLAIIIVRERWGKSSDCAMKNTKIE